ncbi:E3 ubiquitin-protein ligase MIB2 isoform X2 [Dermacentor silvarum]|uniref:E3 ubiquitin-protein ligase MIB2 isoform X2 n=1 Tax=Dermacentor silvarum TaxID=543639 RepID=UPI00189B04E0|nr:E3 ubiquitin-protein ligase MIB2 isoform X2 [Dermacentor silvarum]
MGAGNSRPSSEDATPPERPSDGTRSPGLRTGDRGGITVDIGPPRTLQPRIFSVGDTVVVTDDLPIMKRLQLGHGGYVDSMRRSSKYSVGQKVKICSDVTRVKLLQIGHGGYNIGMAPALGRVGRIVEIDSDGDFKVKCRNGPAWCFNPDLLEAVSDEDAESDDSDSDDVPAALQRIMRDLLMPTQGSGSGKSKLKMTPLHSACFLGNESAVNMMIATGADLNEGDRDGDTALHYAVYGDQPEMVELLINFGVDVNARNKKMYTAIHIAVNKEFVNCVRSLTKYTAQLDVNTQDEYGDTPLHDAVGKRNEEIVDLLVNFPTIDFTVKNKRSFNPFHQAALKGNTHATERILSKKPELVDVKKKDGYSALHLAALNNYYSLAKILLTKGRCTIDLKNDEQQTALLLAVYKGHCDLAELLVEAGANINEPDEDGDTPMHVSLMRRSEIKVQSLSSVRAPATRMIANELLQSRTPGMDGDLALACFLANRGGDLHRKNKAGRTPLDMAGGIKNAELLLVWKTKKSAQDPSSPQRTSGGAAASAASAEGKCKMCLDALANVWFEPCGHRLYCSECCRRMKCCLTCGARITGKVSDAERPALSDDQRELESRLKQLEEARSCGICMERPRNVAFLCGHTACDRCAENLSICHLCRKPIAKKITLF